MKCQKCGKKLQSNEKFCTVCGYYNDSDSNDDIINDLYDDIEDNENDDIINDLYDDIENNKNDDIINDLYDDIENNKNDDIINDLYDDIRDDDDDEFDELKKVAEKEAIKSKEENNLEDFSSNLDSSNENYESLEDDDTSQEEDKSNLSREEIFLMAYIGEDYKLIQKGHFNIFAALLNWIYVIYRKMYLVGIIGLITAGFFIVKLKKYLPIYIIIIVLLLGFLFNKLYIALAKWKINRIEKKYEGSDDSILEEIMEEKGGVNFVSAIIIYFIFIIVVIGFMFPLHFNKNNNTKYWKENSENKANCISLIKELNTELQKNETHVVVEASCKLIKTTTTDYEIYLKDISSTTPNYYYYLISNTYLTKKNDTLGIPELEEKEMNNTITPEEKTSLIEKKSLKDNHQKIYESAKKEDKLIKTKKNTSEKKNYIFSQEEIER